MAGISDHCDMAVCNQLRALYRSEGPTSAHRTSIDSVSMRANMQP